MHWLLGRAFRAAIDADKSGRGQCAAARRRSPAPVRHSPARKSRARRWQRAQNPALRPIRLRTPCRPGAAVRATDSGRRSRSATWLRWSRLRQRGQDRRARSTLPARAGAPATIAAASRSTGVRARCQRHHQSAVHCAHRTACAGRARPCCRRNLHSWRAIRRHRARTGNRRSPQRTERAARCRRSRPEPARQCNPATYRARPRRANGTRRGSTGSIVRYRAQRRARRKRQPPGRPAARRAARPKAVRARPRRARPQPRASAGRPCTTGCVRAECTKYTM